MTEPTEAKMGTVLRDMRSGDRVILSEDGRLLGTVDLIWIRRDKVKIAFRFDTAVRITRRDADDRKD